MLFPSSLPLNIPGPSRTIAPLATLRGWQFFGDTMGTSHRLFKEYGSFVTLSRGGGTNIYSPLESCPGTVLTHAPEAFHHIAQHSDIFHHFPLSLILYRYRDRSPRHQNLHHLITGLFNLNGLPHLQARHHLQPGFIPNAIAAWQQTISDIIQQEIPQWPLGETVNLFTLANRLVTKIAVAVILGVATNNQDVTLLRQLIDRPGTVLSGLLMVLLPYDWPGLPFHAFFDDLEQGTEIIYSMIERGRSHPEHPLTVLSILLDAHEGESDWQLSKGEVFGHVGAFLVAATETTASALVWLLFILSQHPQILADLVDELTAVLGDSAPTPATLKQLPLLDRVIKESLRLFPAVPWMIRVTSTETELCGYPIPTGTEVITSLHHLQQNPDVFENPHEFRPSRWETLQPKPGEYVPFGMGTRSCIGQGLAMMTIKTVLAIALPKLRFEFNPQQPVNPGGFSSLIDPNGILMQLHRQDRQFQRGVGGVQGSIRDMVRLPD